ncbi:MAG: arylsulfotransferase family protein, partial [Gammaproteobacteria bacterium]
LSFRDEGYGSVSKNGEINRYSLTEILLRNNLSHLFLTGPLEPDPYHVNSVHIAKRSFPSKEIKKGDVLLSLRHKSMILQYRPSEDLVVWHKAGPWLNQHDARFKDNGKISLFNNNVISVINQRTAENYYFNGDFKNNIINYDKETEEVSEQYSNCIEKISNDIFTITGGFVYFDDSKAIIEYTDKGLTVVCSLESSEIEIFGKITENGLSRGGGLTQNWLQNFNASR